MLFESRAIVSRACLSCLTAWCVLEEVASPECEAAGAAGKGYEMDEQERRAAENQVLFAQVNDRARELNEAFDPLTPYGSWTCECAELECAQPIELTLAEYEALRAQPARFAVAPHEAHVVSELEDIVEKTDRYWVVEKRGEAKQVAVRALLELEALDPPKA
jgi:hypothetical protein